MSFLSPALCLETASRARLFETTTQIYLTDKLSVHLNDKPSPQELRPYDVLVTEVETADSNSSNVKPTGRDLEAYRGESGSEMLHQNASTALDSILN